MDVEKAGAADVGALTDLRLSYLREDGGALNENQTEAIRNALPGYFEKHLGRDLDVYVIRDGQTIVSCAFLLTVEKPMSPAFPNGRTGTVLNVYTLPAFRRRGYAKKIMVALTGGAKRMGLSVVELKATEAGYPLYRATGFSDSPSKYRLMKWTNPDLEQSTPIK